MSKNLPNIDKLFRDAIEGHEDMPDVKLWDSIDASLDKSNVVHIRRKYNNLKRVAAVLLLLLLSVVGYEVFKTKKGNIETAANNTKKAVENTSPAAANAKNTNSGTASAADKTKEGTVNRLNNIPAAGYDSVNKAIASAEKQTYKTTNPAKLNPAENNAPDVIINNSGNKKNIVSSGNDDVNTDNYVNSASVKKSGKGRTKIKIKSAIQQQYSNENVESENDVNNNAEVVNTLSLKQRLPAATLGKRINQSVTLAATAAINRSVPDAVFKKQRSAKSVRLNLMPFFSPQLIASNIKETPQPPVPGSSPGGPPPPRPGGGDHKAQYKKDEQEQTAYSLGILAELPLGKNWSIQSGISYLSKTIAIEPKKIYARPDKDGKVKYVFDCSSGYSYISSKTGNTPVAGDSITSRSSKNVLGYIGVPVAVNYKFSLGKFNIIPSIGSVFNFLTKQKTETELVQGNTKEKQTINKLQGLSNGYISATAGIAFEYNISKRLAVNLMPSGNFAVTSVNNNSAPVKSYPDAFAVSAGLKIKL